MVLAQGRALFVCLVAGCYGSTAEPTHVIWIGGPGSGLASHI